MYIILVNRPVLFVLAGKLALEAAPNPRFRPKHVYLSVLQSKLSEHRLSALTV